MHSCTISKYRIHTEYHHTAMRMVGGYLGRSCLCLDMYRKAGPDVNKEPERNIENMHFSVLQL